MFITIYVDIFMLVMYMWHVGWIKNVFLICFPLQYTPYAPNYDVLFRNEP